MLRPSRPMMRPFISSFGSATTVIVASDVWSAAIRCMTVVRMRRARSSPSSCGVTLDLADPVLGLGLRLVDDLPDEALARLRGGQPGDALELDELPLLELRAACPRSASSSALPARRARASRSSSAPSLRSSASSRSRSRRSERCSVGALLARLLLGGAAQVERLVLALEDDLLLLGARLGDQALRRTAPRA